MKFHHKKSSEISTRASQDEKRRRSGKHLHAFMMNEVETFYRNNILRGIS